MTAEKIRKIHRLVSEIRERMQERRYVYNDGGPGSGNFGHKGRPGKIGGSAPEGASVQQEAGAPSKKEARKEKEKKFIEHVLKYSYKASSPGRVTSGADGKMTAKSKAAMVVDTKWPQEAGKEEANSISQYIDANGNLSPERQAIHDSIIHDFFADKVPAKGKRTLLMSGGGPASGKSFVANGALDTWEENETVKIDSDDFKNYLPGYAEMAKNDDKAARYYHAESSVLAMRAYQFGAENGVNMIFDGTGDGSVEEMKEKIDIARNAGYEVNAQYVTVDTEEAVKRNKQRYLDDMEDYKAGKNPYMPRKVPDIYVRSCHSHVSDISMQIADQFDSLEIYDNNGPKGSKPVKIATCTRGGAVKAVSGQEKLLQKYLDKGSAGYIVKDGMVRKKNGDSKGLKQEGNMDGEHSSEYRKFTNFWLGYCDSLNDEKEPEDAYVELSEDMIPEYKKDLAFLKEQRKTLPGFGYSIVE